MEGKKIMLLKMNETVDKITLIRHGSNQMTPLLDLKEDVKEWNRLRRVVKTCSKFKTYFSKAITLN